LEKTTRFDRADLEKWCADVRSNRDRIGRLLSSTADRLTQALRDMQITLCIENTVPLIDENRKYQGYTGSKMPSECSTSMRERIAALFWSYCEGGFAHDALQKSKACA
jgi:hypothetical protein